jgi:predicted metallo-beta-lactamase superfamily hydrolase
MWVITRDIVIVFSPDINGLITSKRMRWVKKVAHGDGKVNILIGKPKGKGREDYKEDKSLYQRANEPSASKKRRELIVRI